VLDEPVEPDPADEIGLAAAGIGVEFTEVTFAHEGDGPPTVHGVDLVAAKGAKTGVAGTPVSRGPRPLRTWTVPHP
jgi:hypothetical protein